MYSSAYLKPEIQAATERAIDLVAKSGISGHGAALRWTVYHSNLATEHGDGVIIGVSSPAQLTSNLDMIEQGPLPEELVQAMNEVYDQIAGSEMAYHF